MKQKQQYVAPAILRQTALSPGVALLAGSMASSDIKSVGQEIDPYNYDGNTFNHNWEDVNQ